MGKLLKSNRESMKLLGLFFASVFSQGQYTPPDPTPPPVVDPINCFHCDAANMTHCTEIGEEEPCPTDVPMACMIEVRKRDGAIESVCMGCKSVESCMDNKAQNFVDAYRTWQCHPFRGWTATPSVCRQCCSNADGSDCAYDFVNNGPDSSGPLSIQGWRKNLMDKN